MDVADHGRPVAVGVQRRTAVLAERVEPAAHLGAFGKTGLEKMKLDGGRTRRGSGADLRRWVGGLGRVFCGWSAWKFDACELQTKGIMF